MSTDEKPSRKDEFDELYAVDGGGLDPDDRYTHMSEYQAQRLLDLITEAEFAYEENPIETWDGDKTAGDRTEKAEGQIFGFVDLLLAERYAEIERLKAENARYRTALDDISTGIWHRSDESIICMMDIAGEALHPKKDA